MKYEADELGKHIDILSGYAFKSKDFSRYGIPVIKIKNITPPSVSLNDLSYVSQEVVDTQNKYLLHYNDVLIALTGSHINQIASVVGRVARVKYNIPSVLNQRVGKIFVTDIAGCDIDYVYYYLTQDCVKFKLASQAGGAANQANISPGDVKALSIPFPPIETQHRIADILSAYDDLIENNQKQIKLLEEAAQRLYKEWFIDLRFPGYENTEIVDGVPEGWKKISLSELIQDEIGGGWGEETVKDKCTNPAYVIRGTDINGIINGNITKIPFRYHVESNLKVRRLYDGDIIFEVSGGSKNEGVGKSLLICERLLKYLKFPVICASFCKTIKITNKYLSQYIFQFLQYSRKNGVLLEFEKKSASSIINYRWKDFLQEQYLLEPNEVIIGQFNVIVGNAYNKIMLLSIEMETLQQARDRLLPKLMSGELEV